MENVLIEAGALQQFKHNDGSDGFVFAYEKAIVDREFARLAAQLADSTAPGDRLEEAAAICDGLSTLYDSLEVGYDNGYTMAAKRAAEEIRALKSAAPTAQQSLTAGGAVPEYRAIWALRQISQLDPGASIGTAVFMANESLRKIAAALLPQVQSEPDDGEVMCEECGLLRGESRLLSAIGDAKREAQRSADQQPVTPSGALADNDGGVKL